MNSKLLRRPNWICLVGERRLPLVLRSRSFGGKKQKDGIRQEGKSEGGRGKRCLRPADGEPPHATAAVVGEQQVHEHTTTQSSPGETPTNPGNHRRRERRRRTGTQLLINPKKLCGTNACVSDVRTGLENMPEVVLTL